MILRNLLATIFIAFLLIGCGDNNSEGDTSGSAVAGVEDNTAGDTSDNTISVTDEELIQLSFKNTSSSILTTNNQVVTIEVQAFDNDNAPYSEGNIKVVFPSKAITGSTDVGSFDAPEKELENGKAIFQYTAPDNLQARVNAGDTGSVFGFYHTADKNDTLQAYTFTYAPEAAQITLTDYELKSSHESSTMGLESTKHLSFYVQDKNGNTLEDGSITSINIELLNPSFAILKDTSGREGTSLAFLAKNNVSVSLVSDKKSGIVPVKVTASFLDINGDPRTLSSTFSVIILSGPPTAMSLSYSSTRNEQARAKFVERWILSVTDKYNNPVNTNPTVSMGMIAGYATSGIANSNPKDYLYYEPTTYYSSIDGQIVENGVADQFVSSTAVFGNVDLNNDILVTFGQGYSFNASGKWDFTRVNNTTLELIDNFEGSNTNQLAFAVGHNFRDEMCRFGKKALGIVYPKDSIFTIDSTGSMTIEVEYDYYLVGKNVVLWANIVGNNNANAEGTETVRIGHAQLENLRGLGIDDITHTITAGITGVFRYYLRISETAEWYRNANFGYKKDVTGSGNAATVTTSELNGVDSCIEDGIAYVDINVTSAGSNGSVNITQLLVGDEF
ncbi:MAG: hypothetical protein J7J31_04920 [Helicobacteraceae bacterium]|nr:hypothetical protein [Helicobacteraceae bacterium]